MIEAFAEMAMLSDALNMARKIRAGGGRRFGQAFGAAVFLIFVVLLAQFIVHLGGRCCRC